MTVTWHLCGYDKRTEYLGSDIIIPQTMLPVVRSIVRPRDDDPAYADPVEASADQAARLAKALGVRVDLERFDYFVESEAGMETFVVDREARLARA